MSNWCSQSYKKQGKKSGQSSKILENAVQIGCRLQEITPGAIPIFTLGHLAHLTGVKYKFLRQIISRNTPEPYRLFRINKKQNSKAKEKRFRIICVPDPGLMIVHRWINDHVLINGRIHHSSVAFKKGNNIVKAARLHSGCKWLLKLDIVNFFESINEKKIYKIFYDMGYQPLIAFELARLCTREGRPSYLRNWNIKKWQTRRDFNQSSIPYIKSKHQGHLPQGAPTSPMLANLAMYDFDKTIFELAGSHQLTYTRYADDLTLSTSSDDFTRDKANKIILDIYKIISRYGFEPNYTKTSVVSPRARKVVLGLLVDQENPKLTKTFKANLRQHLYYMSHSEIGPVNHAKRRGFISVYSLKNHVQGLIAHAMQVDRQYADEAWKVFNKIEWP